MLLLICLTLFCWTRSVVSESLVQLETNVRSQMIMDQWEDLGLSPRGGFSLFSYLC